jgi:hypothetical protein
MILGAHSRPTACFVDLQPKEKVERERACAKAAHSLLVIGYVFVGFVTPTTEAAGLSMCTCGGIDRRNLPGFRQVFCM